MNGTRATKATTPRSASGYASAKRRPDRPASMGPRPAPPGRLPGFLAFMEQEAKRLPDVHDSKRGLFKPGAEQRRSALPRALPAEGGRPARGDRKSTRLNSSHIT